jgi:hypothetical protein
MPSKHPSENLLLVSQIGFGIKAGRNLFRTQMFGNKGILLYKGLETSCPFPGSHCLFLHMLIGFFSDRTFI